MTGETKNDETAAHQSAAAGGAATPGKSAPPGRDLLPLPALVAIALYLLLLSGVIILGVVSGRHYPPLFLVFSALFMAASAGLLMLFRWAWAMALATVFLLAIYNLWIFTSLHQLPMLIQGLLNLVFFLYLVRPEVRGKLR
jgi:hypothetical protein